MVQFGEAVVVAVETEEEAFHERTIEDYRDHPWRLVMAILRDKTDDKYVVDILANWLGVKGTLSVHESALGIPVEVSFINSIGQKVQAFGAVKWNTDFKTKELDIYTDLGTKTVVTADIKQIRSWQ